MDSATWCRTPAAASAGKRLRPEVSKNSSTALSSNDGELARSITTCTPATASLRPSPVMVLTPLLGGAATSYLLRRCLLADSLYRRRCPRTIDHRDLWPICADVEREIGLSWRRQPIGALVAGRRVGLDIDRQ